MPDLLGAKSILVMRAGRGIALALAREKARVAIADLDSLNASRVAVEIQTEGGEVLTLRCGIGDESQVERAVNAASEGLDGLNVVINNAGFKHVAPLEQFSTGIFEQMICAMLVGLFLGMKHCDPLDEVARLGPDRDDCLDQCPCGLCR